MTTSRMNSAALENGLRKRPGRLVFFRMLTLLIGLITGLSAAEVGLRIVEKARLGDRATLTMVSDPALGNKVLPNSPGHDANGFRNASVPAHADLVEIGRASCRERVQISG